MEIKAGKRKNSKWLQMACLAMVLLLCACRPDENVKMSLPAVHVPGHTLMALAPKLTVHTTGTTLASRYARLSSGKEFPLTGILRVGDKSYRFMGGDSLRVSALAPLAEDTCGWNGRFTYLYPGPGWEKEEYDDSQWWDGTAAFGSADHYLRAVHSLWGTNNIYVRRTITLDEETLDGRKLYFMFICDDQMKLYCNGEYACGSDYCISQPETRRLSDAVMAKLKPGNNVIATYGHDMGGLALLDFGLYAENNTYNTADTATLRRMDVQATGTHYVFECGEVELLLDFVSPALLDEAKVAGSPVGFITYRVAAKEKELPDVEILFDMDKKWLADNLLMDMRGKGTEYSYKDGHAVFSQKLGGDCPDGGVLLLGYEESEAVQYEGENLLPFWNKDGKRTVKDVMDYVGDNYRTLKRKCAETDARWHEKALCMGKLKGPEEMLPAYRAFLGTHRLVASQEKELYCFGDTLGNVREAYQSFPVLLFFGRTDWMKGLLDPVFEYCKYKEWVKVYPPYDMGTYPTANRQASEEDHGVEVAAHMLMMTLAIVESEKSFDYAEEHWELLHQWACYLKADMPREVPLTCELLNGNDERVKRALGWMAYQKLLLIKEGTLSF